MIFNSELPMPVIDWYMKNIGKNSELNAFCQKGSRLFVWLFVP